VILVTIGTNEQAFDRLVRAAGALDVDEELVVQYGASKEPHGRGEWIDFLSFDELAAKAREARAVICHAGVGSIMMARRCGHTPIVVPRRHQLGEAVDDHQLVLSRRLAQAGLVTLVEDESRLSAAVRLPRQLAAAVAPASRLQGADALSAELHSVLTGFGVPLLSGRAA
jgi:UDP-N-acetylglucosamine transferase subunit ALG13